MSTRRSNAGSFRPYLEAPGQAGSSRLRSCHPLNHITAGTHSTNVNVIDDRKSLRLALLKILLMLLMMSLIIILSLMSVVILLMLWMMLSLLMIVSSMIMMSLMLLKVVSWIIVSLMLVMWIVS